MTSDKMILQSNKEQPGSSMMLRHNKNYHSNGFDVARIASYKSELRRLSERFYVRGAASECGGGVGLRRCFLVRDLRGGVWKVQHRGMGGLEAVRHNRSSGPEGDCKRLFQKNRVFLAPKGPDRSTSGNAPKRKIQR